MAMKHNWEENISVIKGKVGERIVTAYLEDKGYVVYVPITPNPHAFDRLAVKDKQVVIIGEIKSKARLKYYEGTGFNIKNYNEYLYIRDNYHLKIFIFFVDEQLGAVYGNFLTELEKPQIDNQGRTYPLEIPNGRTGQKLIIFNLKNMIQIKTLIPTEVNELKKHTRSNYYT